MRATKIVIPRNAFNFSGQSEIEIWNLKELVDEAGWSAYSKWLVNEMPTCLLRIRELADAFPYWQRRKRTGRPPANERTLLIGYMIKQFFNTTFRATQGLLLTMKRTLKVQHVPDYSVFAKKNSSRRWFKLWKRFHNFVLSQMPTRPVIIATDATGFSGRKRSWRETDYGLRSIENWVKVHAAVEVNNYLILSYKMTRSKVHDSRMFGPVWEQLPDNIQPKRSLADSAYTSEGCLQIASSFGAVPFHDVKSNAVYTKYPDTHYARLVNFFTHWPNRFKSIKGKRAHAETAFSIVSRKSDYRIRCRNNMARKNEVQTKIIAHNIRIIASLEHFNRALV